jgi:polysaccharide deacetylase 2 family uncharacterized protein YibQ
MSLETGSTPRRSGGALGTAVILTLLLLGLLFGGIALFGDAADGEPSASLDIAPSSIIVQATSLSSDPTPARYAGTALVADSALLEATPDGLVPRIDGDGRSAMAAYARPFDPTDTRPRIAIVMLGVGIDPIGSAQALSRLPPEVTVGVAAFVPNGQDVIDAARRAGHEVLLEIPMDAGVSPNATPGPGVLLLGAADAENAGRLNWALSRFTGYVGVTNLLGEEFLASEAAMMPFLGALAHRGLLFLDGGGETSLALPVAARTGTVAAGGAVVLEGDRAAIEARLAELEARASSGGTAIGIASPFTETADVIALWATGLPERGLVLAPVTAVARMQTLPQGPL